MAPSPSAVFLLDTPNIWRGRALAGTPARVLALIEHARQAGGEVMLLVCDRGADFGDSDAWSFGVLVVHPADFYDPPSPAGFVRRLAPDVLVMCEAESLLSVGRAVADATSARLVYDVHDDDAAVAAGLGEPERVVKRRCRAQRAAVLTADYLIASTSNEAKLVRSYGVDQSRLALLPNGGRSTDPNSMGTGFGCTTAFVCGKPVLRTEREGRRGH